jgi:PleD family two-component response regulator
MKTEQQIDSLSLIPGYLNSIDNHLQLSPSYKAKKDVILLVDDNELVRQFAYDVLASEGYKVLEASNGSEALMIAEHYNGPIRLLISDVVMPIVNGTALADYLSISRPDMKVILMSGYSADCIYKHRADNNIVFLQKPFTSYTLASKVRESIIEKEVGDIYEEKIKTKILIVDQSGSSKISSWLGEECNEYSIVHIDDLNFGVKVLNKQEIDIVFIDIDSYNDKISILNTVRALAKHKPVVLLSDDIDEELEAEVLEAGAQEYLIKSRLEIAELKRVLRHSIHRYKLLDQQRSLTLVDDQSGIYTYLGFTKIAEQQLKAGARSGKEVLLITGYLNGLHHLSNIYGYYQLNEILNRAADGFKRTFNGTEVVGRIGWNRFAALVTDVSEATTKRITARLGKQIPIDIEGSKLNITLSYRMAYFRSTFDLTVEEMLAKAERATVPTKTEVVVY